ncbi:MAG: hypothetical protein H6Q69_1562 [Firmicutes bacterium]|nr:hypothetical protein [Bacillota bacterium]
MFTKGGFLLFPSIKQIFSFKLSDIIITKNVFSDNIYRNKVGILVEISRNRRLMVGLLLCIFNKGKQKNSPEFSLRRRVKKEQENVIICII